MQLSTRDEASTSVFFRSGENVLGLSLTKDELFENGRKEDGSFDMSSQLVLQKRSHSGLQTFSLPVWLWCSVCTLP